MGQFALFTYVRPFLETITHAGVSTLSFILLGIGVAGVVGTALIGRFLKGGLYRTLIAISVLMAVIALALIPMGARIGIVASLLAVWGLATAAPVGWWTWIGDALPADAEAGGGLMVAVIQLSIALGSTVGGVLFDHTGYRSTFVMSAIVLLLGAVATVFASRTKLAKP